MKNCLNEMDRPKSLALYYKVNVLITTSRSSRREEAQPEEGEPWGGASVRASLRQLLQGIKILTALICPVHSSQPNLL